MFSKQFSLASLERAIKTFLQAYLAITTSASAADAVGVSGAVHPSVQITALTSLVAALLSIGTSVVSSSVGNNGPSLATEALTVANDVGDLSGLIPATPLPAEVPVTAPVDPALVDPTLADPNAVTPAGA